MSVMVRCAGVGHRSKAYCELAGSRMRLPWLIP
eukprot:CAMPEP_0179218154 /NCGR_PEP_ID=MMETSP0797-20121207/4314_1 /TAXON_ID=47934 /ORGANISM="Dinophysis acuminata, Strain DAEP01" /LENGTH=32 /DNA_ID= /DNA_START= /DNA_END= /DNA_ORIENTATION=